MSSTLNHWLRVLVFFATILSIGLLKGDEASDDYSLAIGLYKQEKWVYAEEAFQKFVTKYPKQQQIPLARFYLGLSQRENKKLAPARATLRAFVTDFAKSENAIIAQFVIAECSYELNEYEAAAAEFAAFTKAVEEKSKAATDNPLAPDYEVALTYLGDCYRRLKKYPEAIATLEKSLNLFSKGRYSEEAKFWLAQSLDGNRQTDRAFELFIEIAGTTGATRADAAQLQVANILFAKGQFAASAEAYARIETEFPKSRHLPIAQLNAGYAYYQLNEFAKAMSAFDRAQKAEAHKIIAGYWKGIAAKALGDFKGAADILRETANAASKDPLAETIHFQLADCLFRAGRISDAEMAFLEVVTRWPTGKPAAESLYFAIDCGLEQAAKLTAADRLAKLKQIELLVDKFAREYGNSGFRLSHQLQRGQFFVLKGTPTDTAEADNIFSAVIAQSEQPATIGEARFRLAKLRQSQGKREGALEALKPLAEQVIKTPEIGFHDTLIVYMSLQIEADQHAEAIRTAEAYLKIEPSGRQRDQVLSASAISVAHLKEWDHAFAHIARLEKEHPESPLIAQAIRSVAELAMSAMQWDRALVLFQKLETLPVTSPYRPAAISGLGWAHYRKAAYVESEARFRQLIKDYPQHELAADAAFMIGDSLQKAEKLDAAGVAFTEAFRTYKGTRYSFLAGLQAARIAVKQTKVDAADKAYAELDAEYPQAKERDQVLNEWALVLAEAEKYDRADEVYRILVDKFPESQHADNARFNLADSALSSGKVDVAEKEFKDLTVSTKSDKRVQEDSLFCLVRISVDRAAWKDVLSYHKSFGERFPESAYAHEVRFQAANAQLNLKDDVTAEQQLLILSQLQDKQVLEAKWFADVWPMLAESQFRQKKYADVLKTAERARQVMPNSKFHYRVDEVVGRAYSKQALWTEAREAFERAIKSAAERNETACKCQFLIGETYLFEKKYQDAHKAFQPVIFLYTFPDWKAAAYYQSGQCEESLQQLDEAKKSYRSLIKEFPQSEFAAKAKDRLSKLGG